MSGNRFADNRRQSWVTKVVVTKNELDRPNGGRAIGFSTNDAEATFGNSLVFPRSQTWQQGMYDVVI